MILLISIITIETSAYAIDPHIISDKPGDMATNKRAQNLGNVILGIVVAAGVAVAFVMLIANGIKYISAAPNEKADIKKHMLVYLFGAIVLFAGGSIVHFIAEFIEEATK